MPTVTIASLNLHHGLDRTWQPYDVLAACELLDADIVALQEVWAPRGEPSAAVEVADQLGYKVHEVVLGGADRDRRLHVRPDPAAGVATWGLAVLSRFPARAAEPVELGRVPLDNARRKVFPVEIDVGGELLDVLNAHCTHRLYGSPRHLRVLRHVTGSYGRPAVLLGDMNMWGPVVHAALPGWRRAVLGRTWPAGRPHSQIDHILVNHAVTVVGGEVLPPVGSDHRPVRRDDSLLSEHARATILEYHELTKHGPGRAGDRSKLVDFTPLDPANRPEPFKRYVDLEPTPFPSGDALARLLFLTGGVTRTADFGRISFRAAMSAGNLHPVEVYVVCADLPALPAGVHHFAPREVGVTTLREGDVRGVLGGAAPVTLVLTGIPFRTAWKYGERGFRHLYWDAGTMLANLLAVAAADGTPARVELGFVDDDVCRLVGIDGVSEVPLALVRLGEDGDPAPAVGELAPLDVTAPPVAPHPFELPLITAAQHAGDLADAAAVAAWQRPVAGGAAAVDSVEDVILRRGSTRAMRHEQVPSELLMAGMGLASSPIAADVPDLLVHLLSVHDVEGTPPGLYRWEGDHLAAGREGDPREAAQQVCLGQPLGGDSAYTVFHATPLDDVVEQFGARGYRAALLQAGIASGRLALAAFAMGYGATGLTFFDDLVSQLFGNPAACMLVTSVGVPDYRSTPGGAPGRPVELTGYGQLMSRLALELRRRRR